MTGEGWLGRLCSDATGVELALAYAGPTRAVLGADAWVARLITQTGECWLTLDAAVALAVVDHALADPRPAGRRVRPLGAIEHGLLLSYGAAVAARITARRPDHSVRVAADPPGIAQVSGGPDLVAHEFAVTCGPVAGLASVVGRPDSLPGPTVVITTEDLSPGDLIFSDELRAPRPQFPAFVLASGGRRLAHWVETTRGVGLEVLGPG